MAHITHCALHVQDIDKSIAFYRDYCGLEVVREHGASPEERTVWIGEPADPPQFVLVLIQGGKQREQASDDMTHMGFAVASPDEVDAVAERAKEAGYLLWEPQQFDFPVGYLCALTDPDGYVIEFSYGQPLGPGADDHLQGGKDDEPD